MKKKNSKKLLLGFLHMVYQARLGIRQSDLSPLDRGELHQAGLGHVSRPA
jgi:hypothetical protein